MPRILVPATSADDWRKLLADPDKHWADERSAKALAECWQGAEDFPPAVARVLSEAPFPAFSQCSMLLGVPEYQVALPPAGSRPSQNDIFVLARSDAGLIAMAVEGKVSETFGPLVKEWNTTPGRHERLAFLRTTLGLGNADLDATRYQLLHRTASAVLLAGMYTARTALMLVHSFSPTDAGLDDYVAFTKLFGAREAVNAIVHLTRLDSIDLYAGWVKGCG